ncbi:Vitellogenin [Armadillidium vulgare]|nr:Vitellogenin [Armadillidium vulgare]
MFGLVMGIYLVLFTIFGTVITESTSSASFPRCVSECAVTGLQKLYYVPGYTYSYKYKGSSQVTVEGIEGATTDLQWEVEADLHWTSPCDVVLHLKNPVLNGIKDEEFIELTKFPAMFSMSEGTVQGICFHPQEEPHNVNFKKGIIASLQNTLPSLSVIHSNKTYKEVDALGSCPTHYTVKSENAKFKISKFKNHFDCSGYDVKLPKALKVGNLFGNSVFSPRISSSICIQEIENGILDTVKCEDSKIYNPTLSKTKYLSFKAIVILRIPTKICNEFSFHFK